jgi:high-affinity iron transporter
MLPTFVIGLREGLEAALIVGIVAAFLRKQGRADLLRWVYLGIGTAVTLCLGAGIALDIVSRNLPQRQQEGLETVIGAFAVAMVSYMIVWMKRNSRNLKGVLEGAAGAALAEGSGWALVAMAFLAVLREGLETAVFLLAAFNETGSGAAAGIGAVLGVGLAVVLGYGIYRGGVRLNLSRFFRATGAVLVLVAAGLVMNAFHTAHEAGWLNWGQQQTVDLSPIIRNGSVQSSILTGVLGLQPRPVLIEAVGWLVYLVPMLAFVLWPPGRSLSRRGLGRLSLGAGVLAGVAAAVLAAAMPSAPAQRATLTASGLNARVVSGSGKQLVIHSGLPAPSSSSPGASGASAASRLLAPVASSDAARDLNATRTGTQQRDGLTLDVYQASWSVPVTGRPATVSVADALTLNHGRLPIGVSSSATGVAVTYAGQATETFLVVPATQRIVDVTSQQTIELQAKANGLTLAQRATTTGLPREQSAAAVSAAAGDLAATQHRRTMTVLAVMLRVLAVFLLVAASIALVRRPVRDRNETASEARTIAEKVTS